MELQERIIDLRQVHGQYIEAQQLVENAGLRHGENIANMVPLQKKSKTGILPMIH